MAGEGRGQRAEVGAGAGGEEAATLGLVAVALGKLLSLCGQQSLLCGLGEYCAHKVTRDEVRQCKTNLRTGLLWPALGMGWLLQQPLQLAGRL